MADIERTPYTETNIPAILRQRERSQAWLARKMGISEATVSRVLRGELPIHRRFVEAACRALDLPEPAVFVMSVNMLASTDKSLEVLMEAAS